MLQAPRFGLPGPMPHLPLPLLRVLPFGQRRKQLQ